MYIPDLRNLSSDPILPVYAVGWLDKDVPFPQVRDVDEGLLASVRKLMQFTFEKDFAVRRTRGIHYCNICVDKSEGSKACVLLPGFGEGVFFLSNFLLPHYISAHRYEPPAEFAKALQRGYEGWIGPDSVLERRIAVSSPEGEEIEKRRFQELLERYPEMKGVGHE